MIIGGLILIQIFLTLHSLSQFPPSCPVIIRSIKQAADHLLFISLTHSNPHSEAAGGDIRTAMHPWLFLRNL
jgi:hypothetical protein